MAEMTIKLSLFLNMTLIKTTAVDEIENNESAISIITKDIDSYVEKFCK